MGTGYDGGIDISHFLSANETSIFYGADPYPPSFVLFVLMFWNCLRFELVLVDNVNNVEGLARILGYRVSSLPMKYLGLLLGASFKAKSLWVKSSIFTE